MFEHLSAALALPWLPLWALATAAHPRLRSDLRERWGLELPPAQVGCAWIHASSVGEVGAAEALIARLQGPVLLTADTDTGAARAREVAATWGTRVAAGARPVDHPFTLAPLWAEARPRVLIFVEGTWWPQLAAMAARAGVPVLRVSARAGQRTRRLARRWWYRTFARHADLTLCQDQAHADWFVSMGLSAVAAGDLKGDRPVPANPLRWERPYVVGASTRPGEEEALLEALPRLPGRPQLLLAPRHPDRFEAVAHLLGERPWTRRTGLDRGRVPTSVEVVLLDTVGELAGCLRGASAAFVGGTFDPEIGGHSPAEAARAGVPVVCGPHRHANAAAFEASRPVVAATPDDLGTSLARAMERQELEPWSSGAVERTLELAGELLHRPPAPEATPRPWAWPLVPLWLGGAALRNLRSSRSVGVPVICVGATNARGPGKTSTTRALALDLAERGHRVGVALRGYRRASGGRDITLSTDTHDAAHLGDEGALLAASGLLVAAGPDRVEAARALVCAGATLVLLDDGLQHRRLHRDLDLLVVDARYPEGRGALPAGERREWRAIPDRVHALVVHHGSLEHALPVFHASRRPGPWHRGDRQVSAPEGPVAALAGIGRAADFYASLHLPVARWRALPDHQPISEALTAEIEAWAGDLPLVCTAKDAVRLAPSLRARTWWRDVEIRVEGLGAWVEEQVSR